MTGTENIERDENKSLQNAGNIEQELVSVIPVVHETYELSKETIETNKIRISKRITEQQTEVNVPLTSEVYEVVRVPVNQVVSTSPEAMRQEGDTTIIPVIKEVLVVEKRYEIIEEIHITKRTTEKSETQHITLRQEEVQIERSPVTRREGNA